MFDRKHFTSLILAAICAMLTSSLFAQSNRSILPEAEDQETAQTPSELAEGEASFQDEIEVVGERHFIGMRYQIRRAEDNLYSMFNDMIDIDEFKVTCRRSAPTGSYILRRRCERRYLLQRREEV